MTIWYYKGSIPTSIVVNGVSIPVAPHSKVEAPSSAIHSVDFVYFAESPAPVVVNEESTDSNISLDAPNVVDSPQLVDPPVGETADKSTGTSTESADTPDMTRKRRR